MADDQFMMRFVDAFREVRRGFPIRAIDASLRLDEGLTADQVEVLMLLEGAGEAQRMGDLSTRLQAHHPNMARTIRWLVNAGHVVREKSVDDGRGVVVKLTDQGRRIADRLGERRDVYYQAILDVFPDSDKTKMVETLERLAIVLANVASNLHDREAPSDGHRAGPGLKISPV